MTLAYEIARDLYTLPRMFGEIAYWQARTWGMTEGDIHATFAYAGFGALAIATFADCRASPGFAFMFLARPLERLADWIFRQEMAFYMARVVTLLLTVMYVGYTLITSASTVFGQGRAQQMADNTRELATHGAAIESLTEWRRNMEAMNMPGRMMVIERNVTEMRDDQKYIARLLYGSLATGLIYLVQQLLAVLRKNGPKQP